MKTWRTFRKIFVKTLAASALAILGVGVGFAQSVSFNSGVNFPAGNGPLHIASGDFNGDGKLDVAVPNSTDDTVSILLGSGSGTFGIATSFGVGDLPDAVAVGDFNGDGKQDLAVTNATSNNVSILLGVGNGTFGEATNFAVGTNPEMVVVGDFNGDGRQDLAATNFVSNNVTILLGNGSGGFVAAAGSPVAVGTNPFGLALGDFNGDGRQDLAVTNLGSNNVSILLGNGSGGFAAGAPVGVGIEPISVAVGDFNGDGRQDLAVANFTGDSVSILLGNGSGGFATVAGSPFPAGDGPRSVAVGDFNGDGRQDLAVAAFNDTTVVILLGNGNGTFGVPAHFIVGGSPAALAVGDFNVDGKLDVVAANLGAGSVTVLLGKGDGTLGAGTGFPAGNGPLHVAIGDFNRDGRLDVAVPNSSDDSVSVLFGTGNGTFIPFTSFAVGDLPDALVVGDFNGDGKRDLAVANALSNNLSVLLNTAPPAAVTLAINDVSVAEGNAGNVNAVFTVTLSQASSLPVAVSFATANGTATAGSDYVTNSGVLTFNPGETSKPITVTVIGDIIVEPDQTFFVNLTNPINATITDGQGIGTIVNDDAGVSASVVAAVLPSSRSVQVGVPATAFATIINASQTIATGCGIAPLTSVPATFVYQTTDPTTNQVTGSPNTPVDIAAGVAQSFVFALTPTGPFAPIDVQFTFSCANADSAPINVGLNTLLLSASSTPVLDIVALAATLSNDGIVTLASTGVFAVATVNVGATGTITATADTGNAILPVDISLCQTDPATGQCLSAIGSSVTTQINANATPTFGVFIQGNGNVPFDPAVNRIFVRFKDGGGVTRGSTSVAARTQ